MCAGKKEEENPFSFAFFNEIRLFSGEEKKRKSSGVFKIDKKEGSKNFSFYGSIKKKINSCSFRRRY